MQYSKFSWLNLAVIMAGVQLFKFFVTGEPMAVSIFLVVMLVAFRARLMIDYWLLALLEFLIFACVFVIRQVFLGLLLYYIIEGLLWWGLIFGVKFWAQEKARAVPR